MKGAVVRVVGKLLGWRRSVRAATLAIEDQHSERIKRKSRCWRLTAPCLLRPAIQLGDAIMRTCAMPLSSPRSRVGGKPTGPHQAQAFLGSGEARFDDPLAEMAPHPERVLNEHIRVEPRSA